MNLGRIEIHRSVRRAGWRVTVHRGICSERGGVWLYRWAITTPWVFIGWRSRAYDWMVEAAARGRG